MLAFLFYFILCLTSTSGGGLGDTPAPVADEIPLTIIATSPAALLKNETVSIEGAQVITAVFSRPIFLLGSSAAIPAPFVLSPEVSGVGEWVTTTVFRFVPDLPFATDLHLTLSWNLKLHTYDGLRFMLEGNSPTVLMTTPTLTMEIETVVSEQAEEVTDGGWGPFLGYDQTIPEVPPDGIIELSFGAPVSLSLLQEQLKVIDGATGEITESDVIVAPCLEQRAPIEGEARCANVSLVDTLQLDKEYALILQAGARYGRASGELKQDLNVTFTGLRSFVVPFSSSTRILFSPFISLYIPHGLAEGVQLEDIPIQLKNANGNPVDFRLSQISKTVLRLVTDMRPRQVYNLTIGASESVIDGFGLPLGASEIGLQGSLGLAYFGVIFGYAVFESSQDWGRKVVGFSLGTDEQDRDVCDGGSSLELWSVMEPDAALPLFIGASPPTGHLSGPPDIQVVPQRTEGAVTTEVDITELLMDSGVVTFRTCEFNRFSYDVFAETSVQVTIVGHEQLTAEQDAVVWVTSMETGEPVAEADVYLFGGSPPEMGVLLGGARTDSDGLARLKAITEMRVMTAVVQQGPKLIFVPRVRLGSFKEERYIDALVVDRRVVRPGETLIIKGYVMERRGKTLVPALGLTEPVLRFSPPVGNLTRIPVSIDPQFGSYEAQIEIPEDAELRNYGVAFQDAIDPIFITGQSQAFTVGEPRALSFNLTITAPPFVPPTGVVAFEFELQSFIGSSVEATEITVSWRVGDFMRGRPDVPETGELVILTDASGRGAGFLDLSDLEAVPKLGTRVYLDAEYLSPNGEPVTDRAVLTVAFADLSLAMSRTVETEIPGVSFGASLQVTDLQRSPLTGDAQITEATLSLVELPENAASDLPSTDTAPLNGPVISSCVARLGKDGRSRDWRLSCGSVEEVEYCDFALPDVGNFALEGCAKHGDAVLCERIFLGKTLEEWEADPLKTFLPIEFTDLTPDELQLGEEKLIQVENPFMNVYALMTWGTVEATEQRVMPLPHGRSTINIEVDGLCEFGCGLSIVISIPRQTEGPSTTLPLPRSVLFDPAQPHTVTYSTTIDATPLAQSDLEVTIAFPEAAAEEGISVVEPGESTTIEVTIDTQQATEVTIIAVEKAFLELLPYSLVDLGEDLFLDLATEFNLESLSEFLRSPGGIDALVDLFAEQSSINPWVQAIRGLADTAFADLSGDAYIERETNLVTRRPRDQRPRQTSPTFGFGRPPAGPTEPSDDAFVRFPAQPEASGFLIRGRGQRPPLESDFISTVHYETGIAQSGVLRVAFTAPLEEGTYVVRAYAASENGIFGSTESEILVQTELSLTPSAPLFVRVGDHFEAGAFLKLSSAVTTYAWISVELDGHLQLLGGNLREVQLDADGQTEAQFSFEALSVGSANLILTAEDEMGHVETLKIEIDILDFHLPLSSSMLSRAETEGDVIPSSVVAQRSIQLRDARKGVSPDTLMAPRGAIVTIKVEMLSSASHENITVNIPLPAGLEPFDPHITNEGFLCPIPYYDLILADSIPCPLQETHLSQVTFFLDSIPAGTLQLEFKALTATTGVFSFPPTQVLSRQNKVAVIREPAFYRVCSLQRC